MERTLRLVGQGPALSCLFGGRCAGCWAWIGRTILCAWLPWRSCCWADSMAGVPGVNCSLDGASGCCELFRRKPAC